MGSNPQSGHNKWDPKQVDIVKWRGCTTEQSAYRSLRPRVNCEKTHFSQPGVWHLMRLHLGCSFSDGWSSSPHNGRREAQSPLACSDKHLSCHRRKTCHICCTCTLPQTQDTQSHQDSEGEITPGVCRRGLILDSRGLRNHVVILGPQFVFSKELLSACYHSNN